MAVSASAACSRVTPGLTRTITSSEWLPRAVYHSRLPPVSCSRIIKGTQKFIPMAHFAPVNSSDATPTAV